MNLKPRKALIDDQSAIDQIVAAAYAHYVPRIGRKPGPMLEDYVSHIIDGHVYVLEYQQSIQGLLVLVPEEHCLLLENVAVAPQAQGRGLGKIMLEFSEMVAIDCNYSSIRLYTHELMVENIQTYLRYGYVETHRAEVNGLRRVYMSKVLSQR